MVDCLERFSAKGNGKCRKLANLPEEQLSENPEDRLTARQFLERLSEIHNGPDDYVIDPNWDDDLPEAAAYAAASLTPGHDELPLISQLADEEEIEDHGSDSAHDPLSASNREGSPGSLTIEYDDGFDEAREILRSLDLTTSTLGDLQVQLPTGCSIPAFLDNCNGDDRALIERLLDNGNGKPCLLVPHPIEEGQVRSLAKFAALKPVLHQGSTPVYNNEGKHSWDTIQKGEKIRSRFVKHPVVPLKRPIAMFEDDEILFENSRSQPGSSMALNSTALDIYNDLYGLKRRKHNPEMPVDTETHEDLDQSNEDSGSHQSPPSPRTRKHNPELPIEAETHEDREQSNEDSEFHQSAPSPRTQRFANAGFDAVQDSEPGSPDMIEVWELEPVDPQAYDVGFFNIRGLRSSNGAFEMASIQQAELEEEEAESGDDVQFEQSSVSHLTAQDSEEDDGYEAAVESSDESEAEDDKSEGEDVDATQHASAQHVDPQQAAAQLAAYVPNAAVADQESSEESEEL